MHAKLAVGEKEGARELVNQFAIGLRELDAPLALAALEHAQGCIDQESTAAIRHLLRAELYDELLCPYEAAQTREQAAGVMLDANDPQAGEPLHTALAAYQDLNATWDWNRVARLARTHGIDVARSWRGGRWGYGDQLSPREREVAELTAEGHTNQQIAQQLFISPKTAEAHVSSIRRKLEVRSRAAIGRRLAET